MSLSANYKQSLVFSGHRQILFAGILTAAVVRFLMLGSKSLWLDEANSLRVAALGQTALWTGASERYHPPLFYFLLEQWMKVGRSEWVLRLPMAILGIVGCLVLYALARDLFDADTALSSLWLAALSPLLVWYAQELRSYMPVMVLGLLATWSMVRVLQTGHLGWWVVLFASMTAAFYTHYIAFLLTPIHLFLVTALLARGRTTGRGLLLWGLVWLPIGLAYAPWINTKSAQIFWDLLTSNRTYVANLLLDRFGIVYEQLLWLIVGGGVILGLIFLWLTYVIFRRQVDRFQWLRSQHWLQWLLVAGFILLLIADVYPRGYSLKRQLSLFWPYVLLLFAWVWPWRAAQRIQIAVVLVAAFAATLVNVTLMPKDQWRETVAHISSQAQEGDLVLLTPTYMTIPFEYYNQGKIAAEGAAPNAEQVASQSEGHGRIWLVAHERDIADPKGVIAGWLTEHASLVTTTSFYNIGVQLYER